MCVETATFASLNTFLGQLRSCAGASASLEYLQRRHMRRNCRARRAVRRGDSNLASGVRFVHSRTDRKPRVRNDLLFMATTLGVTLHEQPHAKILALDREHRERRWGRLAITGEAMPNAAAIVWLDSLVGRRNLP
jgi:hypothetical protein